MVKYKACPQGRVILFSPGAYICKRLNTRGIFGHIPAAISYRCTVKTYQL